MSPTPSFRPLALTALFIATRVRHLGEFLERAALRHLPVTDQARWFESVLVPRAASWARVVSRWQHLRDGLPPSSSFSPTPAPGFDRG